VIDFGKTPEGEGEKGKVKERGERREGEEGKEGERGEGFHITPP
jgi:hypothetical protein